MRILLIEDNRDLGQWLARILASNNYVVDHLTDGHEADEALRGHDYALVVLDLALPGLGGLDVLRRLRARGDGVPVIILTADAGLGGRVAGLDAGADDYLAKPFEIAELEARIRAQLRRAGNRGAPLAVCGDLVFDTVARQFSLDGNPLALTPREHGVLESLILRAGHAVPKERLHEAVFGLDDDADPAAIEVYIHRVRRKLEGGRVRILTLRGLGYLLQPRDDD